MLFWLSSFVPRLFLKESVSLTLFFFCWKLFLYFKQDNWQILRKYIYIITHLQDLSLQSLVRENIGRNDFCQKNFIIIFCGKMFLFCFFLFLSHDVFGIYMYIFFSFFYYTGLLTGLTDLGLLNNGLSGPIPNELGTFLWGK